MDEMYDFTDWSSQARVFSSQCNASDDIFLIRYVSKGTNSYMVNCRLWCWDELKQRTGPCDNRAWYPAPWFPLVRVVITCSHTIRYGRLSRWWGFTFGYNYKKSLHHVCDTSQKLEWPWAVDEYVWYVIRIPSSTSRLTIIASLTEVTAAFCKFQTCHGGTL